MNRLSLKNLTRPVVLTALAGLAATPAAASNFTWNGGDSVWSDHLNWAGPVGLVPSTVSDLAIVAGDSEARTDMDVSLSGLVVQSEAFVSNWNINTQHGMRMFVSGTTALNDEADLFIHEGPALTELDTDTLIVTDHSRLFMGGGKVQVDESMSVTDHSVIWGVGNIEMNSTSGDITLNEGGVYAEYVNTSSTDVLTFSRTANSTSELDWTHHSTLLLAWFDGSLDIQMPVAGSFGGEMSIYTTSFVNVNDAWIGGNGSEINFSGSTQDTPKLTGGPIDHYGDLNVNGVGEIDVPLLALRGQVSIGKGAQPDGQLRLNNNVFITGGDFTATTTDTAVRFMNDGTTTVNGGFSSVNLDGGYFDLDGTTGNRTLNIAEGSTLYLADTRIESGDERLDGTMNVDGDIVFAAMAAPDISNSGDINVGPNGHIDGRGIINNVPGQMTFNGGSMSTSGFEQLGELTVNNDASISMLGDHILLGGSSTTTLNADLTIDSRITVATDAQLAGTGTLRVLDSGQFDLVFDANANVDVYNEGLLTIAAYIVPFDPTAWNAELKSLTLTQTAETVVEFAANDADHYGVNGTANIAGELRLTSVGGDWYPDFGSTSTILTAASVSGEFASVDDSELGDCRRAVVSYHADRVDVTIVNVADVNSDGSVDPADFTAWLAAFNTQDLAGDVNKDGSVTPADFTKWLELFNNGC